jgi:hypothetical protein
MLTTINLLRSISKVIGFTGSTLSDCERQYLYTAFNS